MEDLANATDAAETAAGLLTDQASAAYVGRWRQLVSTTNWEKGRIIAQWRDALIAALAAAIEYSDDAVGPVLERLH